MFYGRSPAFLIIFEELWVFTFYVWPTFRHWISKTIMSTTLAYVILRLVNVTVTDIKSWSMDTGPDLIIAAWTFCSIHLQDFRDVEGDYKTHTVTVVTMLSPASRRKTLQGTAIFMLFVNILSMFWICSRASQISAFINRLFVLRKHWDYGLLYICRRLPSLNTVLCTGSGRLLCFSLFITHMICIFRGYRASSFRARMVYHVPTG